MSHFIILVCTISLLLIQHSAKAKIGDPIRTQSNHEDTIAPVTTFKIIDQGIVKNITNYALEANENFLLLSTKNLKPNYGAVVAVKIINPEEKFFLSSVRATEGDQFGRSIAADEDYVLVSAFRAHREKIKTGATFVYSADGLEMLRELTTNELEHSNHERYFGKALATSAGRAFVSSRTQHNYSNANNTFLPNWQEQIYSFDCESGRLLYTIDAPSGTSSRFGENIAANDTILVASDTKDFSLEPFSGEAAAVHIFSAKTGKYLRSVSHQEREYFGNAISLSSRYLLIGSNGNPPTTFLYSTSGELLLEITQDSPHTSKFRDVGSVFVDPQERFFAIGNPHLKMPGELTGTIRVYTMKGQFIARLAVADNRTDTSYTTRFGSQIDATKDILWTIDPFSETIYGFSINEILEKK